MKHSLSEPFKMSMEEFANKKLVVKSFVEFLNESLKKFLNKCLKEFLKVSLTEFVKRSQSIEKIMLQINLFFDPAKPTKITLALNCLSQSSNIVELQLDKFPTSKVRKATFQEFPDNYRPLLTVDFRCPDFRWKYELTLALRRAVTQGRNLQQKFTLFRMDNGERQIPPLRRAMLSVLTDFGGYLKTARENLYVRNDKRLTQWDHKWMLFVVEQIGQSTFPECVLLIRHSVGRNCCKRATTGKRCTHFDAISRLNTVEYLCFPSDTAGDATGDNRCSSCGTRSAILARPSRCQHSCDPEWCGCVYAKLDVAIWVGTEREASQFGRWDGAQEGHKVFPGKENHQHRGQQVQCCEVASSVQCIVNVHQGKIQAGFDSSGLSDPRLVVLMGNHEMATSAVSQTLSPLWNEVIEFRNIKILDYTHSLRAGDISIMLLLLDEDKRQYMQQNETIGIGWVKCRLRLANTSGHVTHQTDKNLHEPTDADMSLSPGNPSLLDNGRFGGSVKNTSHPSDKPSIPLGQHSQEVDNKISLFPRRRDTLARDDDPWQNFDDTRRDSVLRWVGIFRNGQRMADVLLSVLIVKVDEAGHDAVTINLKTGIPESICPSSKRFHVQVLFAGLRDLHRWTRSGAGRYRVQVVFGELKLMSGLSYRNAGHSMSFSDVYASGYLMLPSKFEYWPPLVVQHVEYTMLKGERVVSSNIINHPELSFTDDTMQPIKNYLINNYRSQNETERISIDTFYSAEQEPLIEPTKVEPTFRHKLLPTLLAVKSVVSGKIKANRKRAAESSAAAVKRRGSLETEYTWWTKFYNSCSSQPSDYKHRLKIYPCELEKVPEFQSFQDWSAPIPLLKKVDRSNVKPFKTYGKLKCKIVIRSTEENNGSKMLRAIPKLMSETSIIVVAYIVQGKNLRSRDIFSLSDAYVKLELGKEKIIDRPNYVKDQSNPLFGRRFVMHGRLPRDHNLKISVIDRDTCSPDDLIGTTTIDVEDRFRTRHFATFGLPQEYNASGYNAWRFPMKPSALLDQICFYNGIVGPSYFGSTVQLAGVTFRDSTVLSKTEDLHERVALTALNNFQQIPVIGCHLVPEHVETRSLFHPDHPGIEQGQLQLWIEVYPAEATPTLVDITPNPPKPYELRLIVWNTQDVLLDERNIFGTKMSDIYVKCWLQNVDEAQFTDIHYRSLDGTGNFNWRMVFPLVYSSSEAMMVVSRKKSFYEQLDTEQKVPPLLTVQVWDNDLFSRDDFLGTLNLNLAQLLRPAAKPAKCALQSPAAIRRDQYLNLFREEKIRGWYPVVGKVNDRIIQTGKIELELQILTEEEALLRPAGKGRKPPQKLPAPDRPDTSFNWYRNPLKSFRWILWPFVRKVCLVLLVIALVVLLCIGLISNTPREIIARGFARKASLDSAVTTGIVEQ
ncbi:hypothetical protein RP20_CCG004777 [Aedes albopictus]|nr:hypothetical protein RP20_CCG004777 [Aedes albopictus]